MSAAMETIEGEVSSAPAEVAAAPEAGAVAAAAVEENKLENTEEEKKEETPKRKKAPREKKPRENPAHPPYFQMIKEAIITLQDKNGSSAYAIAKHTEEKYKSVLPANFKKMLALQLKNFTAKGKLIKIKASFKLSELGKEENAVKSIATAKMKSKSVPKPTTSSTKTRAGKKAAAMAARKKRSGRKGRKSVAAKTKQPKSIKSPAAKKVKKLAAV